MKSSEKKMRKRIEIGRQYQKKGRNKQRNKETKEGRKDLRKRIIINLKKLVANKSNEQLGDNNNTYLPNNDSASVSKDIESSFTTQKQGSGLELNRVWNCEMNLGSSP